jgi:hypothetical protein
VSDPFGPESLSSTRHYVLALRLVVSQGRGVRGEIVDPETKQGQSFLGLTELCDVLADWIRNAERGASGVTRVREEGPRPDRRSERTTDPW